MAWVSATWTTIASSVIVLLETGSKQLAWDHKGIVVSLENEVITLRECPVAHGLNLRTQAQVVIRHIQVDFVWQRVVTIASEKELHVSTDHIPHPGATLYVGTMPECFARHDGY